MHIQYNYANIDASDALQTHVEQQLESQVGHLYKHLTGFEVHIADENSSKKHGPDDKRCTIEARPRGRDPITVEAHAADFYPAINDAAHKLRSALTKRLERD
ncbi:MAG: ribosome-associated translation inhibitor RaiA [Phycisphaerales bacterium]|jgi:ribosomal subunit interface protein